MPELTHPRRVLLLSAIGTRINPYIGLLRDGLAAAGADVRLVERLDPATLVPEHQPDVIHLHWLERYDLPPTIIATGLRGATDPLRRVLRRLIERAVNLPAVYQARRRHRLRRLFAQLAAFQAHGGRVAYTVHNLDPHEDPGAADRWAIAHMLRVADVLHVHDHATAEALAARFGRRKGVIVVPHGHYVDSYPNTISRAAARARLGVPEDAFAYVCLGLLRPYKGLEELIPAFRGLAGADLRLLLAGQPAAAEYLATLTALIGADPRIQLTPRLVPPEELQVYFNAADICVLPYRQITTSGAALLAFSFGLPIIAPAIGAFPNLIVGHRGILYDPTQPHALARALDQARTAEARSAQAEILAWVKQFAWDAIGAQLLEAYQQERVTEV